MAKKIMLETGKCFKTISEAKLHFSNVLESVPINKNVEGDDFRDIMEVYRRYCVVTAWQAPSAAIDFFPVYESGEGYTTRCFGIRFEDGTLNRFSMQKALSKIAE